MAEKIGATAYMECSAKTKEVCLLDVFTRFRVLMKSSIRPYKLRLTRRETNVIGPQHAILCRLGQIFVTMFAVF